VEICRELARMHEHPDAETVCRRVRRRLPGLSLDTVYRTLKTLEAEGVIRRVGSGGDRVRFDANLERHHHFICSRCGAVHDFPCKAFDRLTAPRNVKAIGVAHTVNVEVRGLCAACAAAERQRAPASRRPRSAAGKTRNRRDLTTG